MNALINGALGHARTILSALVMILLAGAYAYVTISKESNPDINIPIIYVSLSLEGISPEDAERLLVRPMEEELRGIEGVKEMTANAYEGGANVVMEFTAGFDAGEALTDVREGVDLAAPELPDEADEPTVHEVNFSLFPVIAVTLSGDVPERTLVRLARQLRDRLEALTSVLEVNIGGDREELVELVIDPMLVESYGLNGAEVIDRVSRSNRLVPAGNLDTGRGRFAVKVPGLFESVQDIVTLPIAAVGDAVVQFRDIAEIRNTFRDPDGFARIDGQPAVVLEVSKRTGENIIDTIAAVRAVVAEESVRWPPQVSITYTQDQSNDIRIMLADLQNNVISAVVLVMVVIVGALGLRSAGLVGVAIPGSFLTGLLVLYAMGLTVNIVVLFSLILAVGMLVDGAIVVTEYADRKMAEGLDRRDAYRLAAQRMAWPISASTATTLAAFLPLLFWPGVVGEFMKFLPITLVATLAASLAMALIFVPTLGSLVGKPGSADPRAMAALAAGEQGDVTRLGGFTGAYVRFLSKALDRAGLVILAAALVLVGTWVLFATQGKGVEFFPDVEPEAAIVLVHARGNLSVEEEDALVREVETRVLAMAAEFDSVYTRTGGSASNQDVAEDVIGQILIELKDWQERRPADAILADIRAATVDLAGITIETREPDAGPPVGKPVQVELSAADPAVLPDAVAALRGYMESLDGLVDIEDSRPVPGIEWRITVDRAQAAKFGLDVTQVGNAIKLVTNGLEVGSYRPDAAEDEIDIVVRYPARWRTLEQLDQLRVVGPEGPVPISNFVTRTAEPAVGTLQRTNGRRVMTVQADVEPGVLPDTLVGDIRAWIAAGNLDPTIGVTFRGEDEEQAAAADFLSKAFVVALFMMAIILVTQFNSFYSAFLIMSAVVMSTVGVLLGLLVTGQPFGIVMTGIGVIALAGIVVNNNIVLIDTFDRLRREAGSVRDAILRTGAQRLRPVLLTTVTTVLGLMPMVLAVNIDFVTRDISVGAPSTQWWKSLATAIVFGLSFATILTLVVTPSALMVRARVQDRLARRRGSRGRPGRRRLTAAQQTAQSAGSAIAEAPTTTARASSAVHSVIEPS